MSRRNGVDAVVAALAAAGVGEAQTARLLPLTGGTYNTVVRATLHDGREWVVKIPPKPSAGLSYERGLLKGEVTYCTAAAAVGEPAVPGVVHSELRANAVPGPHVIMTALRGRPWHEAEAGLSDEERSRLRAELGRLAGRLHTVTGPGYGYPAEPLRPLAASWRQAFTAMTDALLADAERYEARLPRPVAEIQRIFSAAADVLDDVTRPALVHFDLWQGNLLLAGEPGGAPSAVSSTVSACSGVTRSPTSPPRRSSGTSRRTRTSWPATRRPPVRWTSMRPCGSGWRSTGAIST